MTPKLLRFSFLIFLFLGFSQLGFGQDGSTLEINSAGLLKGEDGFERLLGDVEMKHQNSLIYCDSAHFYREENRARLFGNVRIVDVEDPVQTNSAYAEYDGNTKMAKLRNGVVFKNENTTLRTEYLDYDRGRNIAYYYNGGEVVDSVNVLTSEKGKYEVSVERITFEENVVLVNPDYTMKTNDLVYLTIPKTAETKGLTNLISKDGNTLDAQEGSFYDTQAKKFRFFEGIVETETSRIKAKELYYSEVEAYYEGKENVRVLNKEREVEVFGDVGEYWEERKYSLVHGNALVRRYFEQDTLYMTADSLISQDSEADSSRYLLAFRAINLVKQDLSGVADSLVYNYNDSTIELFQDPVMWNQKSQITADSMVFYIANEQLDHVFMKDNAFVITQDTLLNFNQMKGRVMNGYFLDGQMDRLEIDGNGESLYFALQADTVTQGINKTLSANIKLRFKEGAINRVTYGVRPDGEFKPFQLVTEDNSRLEGFNWRFDERPTMAAIHAWRRPEEIDPDAENFFNLPDIDLRMPTDEELQKSLEKRGWKPEKSSLQ
ncbi:organic solvent tolerance protein OstA [Algoriphagus halophytocola]|uniref:Organic solvent tolerance protein OstA n=1 Tax=Algoriphagus halophytocola TaxID=2991499 RepID=A0ABY6MED8_9BACT|nr:MULTISPECIES: OstA-like protein [unclassified Algoriphagus]UZD22167.1 organic solvent tolerance protein OstA [Algoriphagus sp. TR-M5]WBL43418.1 organic solvent tolerance protein OstA [Algoriphagus sp. TR-M9]